MNNEIEQIAQQNKMSIEFVTWFFNEKKSACGEHWFLMLGAMWEGWKGRSIEMDKLAAENVAARNAVQVFCDVVGANTDAICEEVGPEGVRAILAAMSATGNMPATDRILAEIKSNALPANIAEIIDSGDLESILYASEASYSEEYRMAFYNFRQLREGADK